MNKTCFWRIRGLAAMTAMGLLLAGCGPQSKGPGDTAGEQKPPAPQEADAATAVASSTRYRELEAPKPEDEHCIVRSWTDEDQNPVLSTQPTIALPNSEDWTTIRNINLERIPHHGRCPAGFFNMDKHTMAIAARQTELPDRETVFDVVISGPNGETMTQEFRYPRANAKEYQHAYLVATPRCNPGERGCGTYDHYKAYLYVVDTREAASAKAPKLVLLDLFDPADLSGSCPLELPENAMEPRRRAGGCPLPDWVRDQFPIGDSAPARTGMKPMHGSAHVQTGTGGGYEPPP